METSISLIIPVYNTQEAYLRGCLEQALKLRTPGVEILIVDDGSERECAALLDGYAASDARVRVFHLPNGGVSRARNYGIEHARGSYVSFVDSDDLLNPEWFDWAYAAAERAQADAVYGRVVPIRDRAEIPAKTNSDRDSNCRVLKEDEVWKIQCGLLVSGLNCNEAIYEVKLFGNWGKLFKKSIVQSERYIEGMYYGEDQVFNHQLLRHVKRAIYSPEESYYLYTNREGSATNTWDAHRLDAVLWFLEKERAYIPENAVVKNAFWLHVMDKSDCLVFHRGRIAGRKAYRVADYKKMIDEAMSRPLLAKAIAEGNIAEIRDKKKKLRYYLIKHRRSLLLAFFDKYYSLRKAEIR